MIFLDIKPTGLTERFDIEANVLSELEVISRKTKSQIDGAVGSTVHVK